MSVVKFVAPCLFGMEAVLKKEIEKLGLTIDKVDDGRVRFMGEISDIPKCNINLRTTSRIMIELASKQVTTFDELYDLANSLEIERYIPKDGQFYVSKATSIKSKIFSSRDVQKIVKKAMSDRLMRVYGSKVLHESGSLYPIRVFFKKDICEICLDTSHEALHKRGYRLKTSRAPLSETLAAGLVMLSKYNGNTPFIDPFCGSGTIVIEAAMIAANIAPGLNASFISEDWDNVIEKKLWVKEVSEALDKVEKKVKYKLIGYDINPEMVKLATENAYNAGVDDIVHFETRDVKDIVNKNLGGIIVTNPPYGKRLDQYELEDIYKSLYTTYSRLNGWNAGIITSYDNIENIFETKAKKRKLYNGMLKTYFYSYKGSVL